MFISMKWLARHVDLTGITPEQLKTPVPSDIECSQSITPNHISEVRLLPPPLAPPLSAPWLPVSLSLRARP